MVRAMRAPLHYITASSHHHPCDKEGRLQSALSDLFDLFDPFDLLDLLDLFALGGTSTIPQKLNYACAIGRDSAPQLLHFVWNNMVQVEKETGLAEGYT